MMSTARRLIIGFAACLAILAAATGGAKADSPACPTYLEPELFLHASATLVAGKTGEVDITNLPNDAFTPIVSAYLGEQDQTGAVIYSHEITPAELQQIENSESPEFPVPTTATTTAVTETLITLVDNEQMSPAEQCVLSQHTTTRVKPTVPTSPMVILADRPDNELSVGAPHGNCKLASPGTATVNIQYSGITRATYDLASPCSRWSRERGPAPGVKVLISGGSLGFVATGIPNVTYHYVLTARVAGRAPRKFALTTEIVTGAGSRIYQGTDSFVNVCIDQGLKVYSSNGKLYCYLKASRTNVVDLH